MEFFGILYVGAIFYALMDWRKGLLAAVSMAFLQDVLRKMIPGEPIYLIVLFVPVLLVAMVTGVYKSLNVRPSHTFDSSGVRIALVIYMFVLTMQIIVAYMNTRTFIVPVLGMVAYGFPILGLIFSVAYVRREPHFIALMHLYIGLAAIAAVGVFLRVYGVEWDIVDSVGEGIFVYPPSGGRLELPSGFMRSPEIAAWHCGTAALVVVTLMFARLWRFGNVAGFIILVGLATAVLLTGRRKIIAVAAIYVAVFLLILIVQRRFTVRQCMALLLGFAAAAGIDQVMWANVNAELFTPYVERNSSLTEELGQRFNSLVIDGVKSAYRNGGFLGIGAGAASQGGQHFSSTDNFSGVWAEGGIAKILVEMGIHGSLAVLILIFTLGREVRRQSRFAASSACQPSFTIVHAGMLAIMFAHMCAYAVASQAYGDPFILFMLGIFSGVCLSATSYGVVATEPELVPESEDYQLAPGSAA